MPDKRYSPVFDGSVTVSSAAAEKLISSGDGTAALLYIYLMKNHGEVSTKKASFDLNKPEIETERAFSALVKMGLASDGENAKAATVGARPEELPSYSAEDIRHEMESGNEFSLLVSEVQQAMGKILSSDDLIKLFGIYDCLGLSPEVILLLINHCLTEFNERYNGRRRPTMRYIEKAAFSWEKAGIYTLDLAERYIKQCGIRKDKASLIKSVLNIKDRALTVSEEKYVNAWADMDFPIETIEIAYDKTVLRTGTMSWSYMNSILNSWFDKGLKTPEEVQNENKPSKTSRSSKKVPENKDENSSSVTAEDIERMQQLIRSMNDQ